MGLPEFVQRSYEGAAPALVLAAPMGATDLSFTASGAVAAYPDGSGGPFSVTVDRGIPSEEKILCTASNAGTGVFTVFSSGGFSGRGYDGTVAQSHTPNPSIQQVQLILTAEEMMEANLAVLNTIGRVTTEGDILVATGPNAFQRLGAGAVDTGLKVTATDTLGWVALVDFLGVGSALAGSVASAVGLKFQAGYEAGYVCTNGLGPALPFPTPFPTGLLAVLITDYAANDTIFAQAILKVADAALASFKVQFVDSTGTAQPSGTDTIDFTWLAIGI